MLNTFRVGFGAKQGETVEKLANSDFFTDVVKGTRDHKHRHVQVKDVFIIFGMFVDNNFLERLFF